MGFRSPASEAPKRQESQQRVAEKDLVLSQFLADLADLLMFARSGVRCCNRAEKKRATH